MDSKTKNKFNQSTTFILLSIIILFFSSFLNFTLFAEDFELITPTTYNTTIGAVVPSQTNGTLQTITNVNNSIIQNISAASVTTQNQITLKKDVILNEDKTNTVETQNLIQRIIEKNIDFILPRTGGNGNIVKISLFLSILGLLICWSTFKNKN
jgi:hypothetical protein